MLLDVSLHETWGFLAYLLRLYSGALFDGFFSEQVLLELVAIVIEDKVGGAYVIDETLLISDACLVHFILPSFVE